MPAQLVALDEGPSILLDKPILLLGRHPECDIQIDSRKVSRRHCCIAQVSDYLVVRDLGSTNGIRINGARLVEGRLSADDELTIGNFRYRVTWDAVAAAAAPPISSQPFSPPPGRAKAQGPSRKKTFHEPSPPEDSEDELLESCEEPVPLEEPKVDSPPPAGKERPLLRLDPLELMPNSDLFGSNAPPPSSPSAHPS
jgi:predicted component of type VI protein secretion system